MQPDQRKVFCVFPCPSSAAVPPLLSPGSREALGLLGALAVLKEDLK
jgi:hypothetical protein